MMPSRWDLLTEPFAGKLTKRVWVWKRREPSVGYSDFARRLCSPGKILLILEFIPNVGILEEMGKIVCHTGKQIILMDVQGRWSPARRFDEL